MPPRASQVCSEAFYNLLCHFETRLKLLQKDLWWALMRLTKVRPLARLEMPRHPVSAHIQARQPPWSTHTARCARPAWTPLSGLPSRHPNPPPSCATPIRRPPPPTPSCPP